MADIDSTRSESNDMERNFEVLESDLDASIVNKTLIAEALSPLINRTRETPSKASSSSATETSMRPCINSAFPVMREKITQHGSSSIMDKKSSEFEGGGIGRIEEMTTVSSPASSASCSPSYNHKCTVSSVPLGEKSISALEISQQTNETINDTDPIFQSTATKTTANSASVNSSLPNSPGPDKIKRITEETLNRLISQAEYELDIDPYRGLCVEQHQSYLVKPTTKDVNSVQSPWMKCQLKNTSLANEVDGKSTHLSTIVDEHPIFERTTSDLVSQAMLNDFTRYLPCLCPCLEIWTAEAMEKVARQKRSRKKKRKRKAVSVGNNASSDADQVLITDDTNCNGDAKSDPTSNEANDFVLGLRPSVKDTGPIPCACDWNPYCLVSMGGVMNDILSQHFKNLKKDGGSKITNKAEDENSDVVMLLEGKTSPSCQTTYSASTLARLKGFRKYTLVQTLAVSQYLDNTLQSILKTVLPLQKCLDILKCYHKQLCFECDNATAAAILTAGSVSVTGYDCSTRLRLSMPPGIQNLGATCYLNTQLQCLAQNPVFLEGIFAWQQQSTESVDRMHSVLSLFQRLLAKMAEGHENTVNALEFSNALGLDHFEQQDPNEFSRLFLERIHQSFQESSNTTENGGTINTEERNLAMLLPELFQGKMAYETLCLTCKNVSRRVEEFMDLNLPIVHPSDDEKSVATKAGQLTLSHMIDTDVQYCLDRYCRPETLEGENKYHCSFCDSKEDAVRALAMVHLPPVLNVQLSRYVFDRQKLMKKKLADRVWLPLDLQIEAKAEDCNEMTFHQDQNHSTNSTFRRYRLCAVMRHQGTSAYSGHYIAEAMDWLTGQWFEFNDENVTRLDDGPSCSIDSSLLLSTSAGKTSSGKNDHTLKGNNASKKRLGDNFGSKDAYNMYYVEENFLAQSVLEALRKKQLGMTKARVTEDICRANVLLNVGLERAEMYSSLANMCREDEKLCYCLSWRHRKLSKILVRYSMAMSDTDSSADGVWIESESILRYLQCKPPDNVDELFHIFVRLTNPFEHLCNHGVRGMHPQDARLGKLVSRKLMRSILNCIQEESVMMKGFSDDRFADALVHQIEISPSCNMYCTHCCNAHLEKLRSKFQILKAVSLLYTQFNAKFEFDIILEDNEPPDLQPYAYVVSRRFITHFRNNVARVMKIVAATVAPANNINHALCEHNAGLDKFDMSLFGLSGTEQPVKDEKDDVNIDLHVNSNIACEHGNCLTTNKRSIRYFPFETWELIKQLFPQAIQLRRKRMKLKDIEVTGGALGCKQCEFQNNADDQMHQIIHGLLNGQDGFKSIKINRIEDVLDSDFLVASSCPSFKVLHERDWFLWQKLLNTLQKCNGSKVQALQLLTESLLPILSAEIPKIRSKENDAADRVHCYMNILRSIFAPISCELHRQPLREAIFRAGNPWQLQRSTLMPLLHDHIVLIEFVNYTNMIKNLCALILLLESSNITSSCDCFYQTHIDLLTDAEVLLEKLDFKFLHPVATLVGHGIDLDGDVFAISNATFSIKGVLYPRICSHTTCVTSYMNWQDTVQENTATVCIGQVDSSRSARSLGTVAGAPIVVDSDIEDDSDYFLCHVFELQSDVDVSKCVQSICDCANIPVDVASGDNNCLRRSSRKRKTRYPMGPILDEDSIRLSLGDNVAAVRLKLLERYQNGSDYDLAHSLKLLLLPSSLLQLDCGDLKNAVEQVSQQTKVLPLVISLKFSMNTELLRDICEREFIDCMDKNSNASKRVILVRQSNYDETASGLSDSLLDHLIEISNVKQGNSQNVKPKAPEKGFSGTFLSSTITSASVQVPPNISLTDDKKNLSITMPEPATELQPRNSLEKSSTTRTLVPNSPSRTNGGRVGVRELAAKQSNLLSRELSTNPTKMKERDILEVLNSEDDADDTVLFQQGLTTFSMPTVQSHAPPKIVRNDKEKHKQGDDRLVLAVVEQLMKNSSVNSTKEGICYIAAEWAVNDNAQENDVTKLADLAFAKYVEQTMTD